MKKTTRLMLVSLVTLAMLLALFPATAGTQEVGVQSFWPPWPPTPPQPPTPQQPVLTVEINPEGSGDYSQSELIPGGWDFYGYYWLVTLTAIPADGWEFDYWSWGGPFAGESSETTYYNFPIYDDITITANFKRVNYTLTLEADPDYGGNVSGGGNYAENDTVEIRAQEYFGYKFVNWTNEDGEEVSNEAIFNYTMPAGDVKLTANFRKLVPGISVTKDASVEYAYRGDEITYTITVENTGEVDFYLVDVSDSIMDLGDDEEIYNLEAGQSYTITKNYTIPSNQDYGPMKNTASVEAYYGEGGIAAFSIVPNGDQYYEPVKASAFFTVEIIERPSRPGGGSSGSYSPDDYNWGPPESNQPQPQPEPEPEPEEEVTEIIPEVPEAPPATPVEVTEETPEEAPEEVVEEVTPELPKTGGNALLLLGLGSLLGGAGILFERRRARKR